MNEKRKIGRRKDGKGRGERGGRIDGIFEKKKNGKD